MAKLSDAERLARLLAILAHLRSVDRATVGELARRFGGSPRSVYQDLLAAWVAEDPEQVGIYPFQLHVEYFAADDPDRRPVAQRECWLAGGPGSPGLDQLLDHSWAGETVCHGHQAGDGSAQPGREPARMGPLGTGQERRSE